MIQVVAGRRKAGKSVRASAAIVIGTLLLASPAWADHSSVHATASGEIAATDNVNADGSGQQADAFVTVRPGLLYAYDAQQMIHDLSAEAEVTEFLMSEDRPLITGRAGWKSLFLVTPRLQLNFTINASTGLLTQLAARTTSDQTITSVMPSGKVDVQQADTGQTLSWVSGKHTRINQGVFGRYGFTDDGAGTTADTREVGGNLGLERTFTNDSVTLDASVSYLKLERIAPPGAEFPSRLDHQLNPRATVAWRHDIDKKWSANGDGGVVFVNPVGVDKYNPGVKRRDGTFAIFGAQIAYLDRWGRALLSARRNVSPNQFLAQNTVEDAVNFQVAMPLPWLDENLRNPKLVALGSAGVGQTSIINSESGSTMGNFKVAHADFTLGYTPKAGQTYGLRFETAYQSGDRVALMEIPAFVRNTVFFTFSFRYPDRVPGELPKRQKTMRSDRKDMMGSDELIIPDIFEDAGDDGGK
jgi:hypothetical protein